MHFSGLEIGTANAHNYGECCEACGLQQLHPGSKPKCSWIEWNPNIPQPQCTLKTGEGNVAGQHNGIMSGPHGPEKPPPPPPPAKTFACSRGHCFEHPLGNFTSNASCSSNCKLPPPPPPPPPPPSPKGYNCTGPSGVFKLCCVLVAVRFCSGKSGHAIGKDFRIYEPVPVPVFQLVSGRVSGV